VRQYDKLLMQAAYARRAMRKALADTFKDPDFQAEAEKASLIVNAPKTGQELQQVIEKAYATPSRVVERLQKLNNPGN
jgi:tripartite-type tricarboxylate transporter receptor subunit TctC